MEKNRIHWIDMSKGICMMAILLFHTEVYYNEKEIINYNLYVCNVLTIFFFLSGYHFYKVDVNNKKARYELFFYRIKSILRKILMPYIIFTSIIAFPKALAHGDNTDFITLLTNILSGNASWFIAALFVAELFFSIALYISNEKNTILCISSILMFILSIYLSLLEKSFCWQLDNACMAYTYLYLGYIYHKKENKLNFTYKYILILFITIILIKIYVVLNENVLMLIHPIKITNIPVFIIDSLISIFIMINVCKWLPTVKLIEWTGAHSLVYYFFCGAVPLIVTTIMRKLGYIYEGYYFYVLIAFIIVYFVTTFVTWFIYKYLPFTTGKIK